MTGSLILDVILSVAIVLVIIGMLGWAVVADRHARIGSESRVAASPAVTDAAASPSVRRDRLSGSATARAPRHAAPSLPLQ